MLKKKERSFCHFMVQMATNFVCEVEDVDEEDDELLMMMELSHSNTVASFLLTNVLGEEQKAFILHFLFDINPGRGYFERPDNYTRLVNLVEGWSRYESLRSSVRESGAIGTLGVPSSIFEWVASFCLRWINLPRRFSKGYFHSGVSIYNTFDFYANQLHAHARPPSQSAIDRFMHFYMMCRIGGTTTTRQEQTRYVEKFILNLKLS